MKKNMGTTDRVIRIIIALVLGVLVFTGVLKGIVAIILSVLAVVFVLTSIIGFCPIYTLFGIHTLRCRISNDE
jgi:hypothetical protein